MYLALLFLLGLIFGSFLNAAVSRMHAGQSFVRGRSQCDACGHQLAPADLVPIFSWLVLKGRCRYCRASISWLHPLIELVGGIVLAASYLWWPVSLSSPGQSILFAGWIITAIGLMALAVYDLRWMLLPNRIIYPTLLVAAAARAIFIFGYQAHKTEALISWGLAIAMACGIFLAIFLASQGRWIGYGDVRLGLITGTVLAVPSKALLMIFSASLLGTFVALLQVLVGHKNFRAKIAFGPFLIAGTFMTLLFGQAIIDWYSRVFLG